LSMVASSVDRSNAGFQGASLGPQPRRMRDRVSEDAPRKGGARQRLAAKKRGVTDTASFAITGAATTWLACGGTGVSRVTSREKKPGVAA
jgi:hypothetical protein